MLRPFQRIFCLLLLLCGVQHGKAFTLLGDFDNWQVNALGFGFGELGGSKSLGEEYRLNTPIITYGFDSTFLDFFGADGVKAVDEAFVIMNRIPKTAKMSPNLTEFLTDDAQRTLPSAEALNLLDLKSATLGLLIEHMGLAGEEHVFDLRQRISVPGTCQFDYQVLLRNFDPLPNVLTPPTTRFVNGTLYTYEIVDFCPTPNFAFAVEKLVDPTDIPFNAVASFKGGLTSDGQRFGGYYINITRDDAGGLRYLYRSTNLNWEILPPDARSQGFFGPWQPVDFFGTNAFSTNFPATRGGIQKVNFRKTRFDSSFGTFFQPRVLTYTLPLRTNFNTFKETVRRAIFRPDILFTAADLSPGPATIPLGPSIAARSIAYRTNGVDLFPHPESIGPGIILPQTLITFHKSLPQFFNFTDFFLDEVTSERGFLWASFDGSTNDPVIYPQGSNLRDLERKILSGQ
jgi:hypothetical protein